MSLADYIASKLFGGGAKPPAGRPVRTITVDIKCTVTVPAGQEANSVLPVKFTYDPTVGEVSSIQIPKSEKWTVTDVFVKESSDIPIDGFARLFKNIHTEWLRTPQLSVEIITYHSRPPIEAKEWGPGDILTAHFITSEKNEATTAQTVTFWIRVIREIYE